MKSFVLLITLTLFIVVDFTRAAGHDFPKITGNDPLDISNSVDAELKCHVEKLNDTIAWIYNDTVYLSCDYPYSVGTCIRGVGYPYQFYTYEKENMFKVIFTVIENENDGNWTCRHGNETSHPYDLDTGRPPSEPNFTLSNMNPSESENLTLTCTAPTSDDKLTRIWIQTSSRSERVNLTNVVDPTNQTYTYIYTVDCRTITYFCCIWNRFGYKCARHDKIEADCPVKFRNDKTSPNVTAYEGDQFTTLKYFYTGLPMPGWTWYKLENETEVLLTDYRFLPAARLQCNPHGMQCLYALISQPIEADTGYYVVHANASGTIDKYTFHLSVLPPKAAPTTEAPSEQKPCSVASSDELTFGQGIGIGIAIGLGVVLFVAGGIYGCRKA